MSIRKFLGLRQIVQRGGGYHLRWQTEIDMKEKSKNKIKKVIGDLSEIGSTLLLLHNRRRRRIKLEEKGSPRSRKTLSKGIIKEHFPCLFFLSFWEVYNLLRKKRRNPFRAI